MLGSKTMEPVEIVSQLMKQDDELAGNEHYSDAINRLIKNMQCSD